jgi:hypothetical protein
MGFRVKGNHGKNGHSLIPDEIVKMIRDAYQQGVPQKSMAEQYNLHKNVVSSICQRKTYQHVP